METGETFGFCFRPLFLRFRQAVQDGVAVRLFSGRFPRPLLAGTVEIYRLCQTQAFGFGPTMFSGRTTASKVASSTKPSAMASSLSVVRFLCAVLATLVALS